MSDHYISGGQSITFIDRDGVEGLVDVSFVSGEIVSVQSRGDFIIIGTNSRPFFHLINLTDFTVESSDFNAASNATVTYATTLSDDGSLSVVTNNGTFNTVRVINNSTLSVVASPSVSGVNNDCVFSKNGNFIGIARVTSPRFALIDTLDYSLVSGLPSLNSAGNGIALNSNGSIVAVAQQSHTMRMFSTADWSEITGFDSIFNAQKLRFSPDDTHLAIPVSSSSNGPKVIKMSDLSVIEPIPGAGSTHSCVFSPSGAELIFFGDENIYIVDTATWTLSETISVGSSVITGGIIRSSDVRSISGTIYDSNGLAAVRDLAILKRENPSVNKKTTSDVSGNYKLPILGDFECCRIAFSDDASEGVVYNDLIDRVIPG